METGTRSNPPVPPWIAARSSPRRSRPPSPPPQRPRRSQRASRDCSTSCAPASATTSSSAARASWSSTSINGHKFVKRIATTASTAAKPRNIKGVVASASDRQAPLHDARNALLRRSRHREDGMGQGPAPGLRSARRDAGREDALRAVVREGHLERRRGRDGQGASPASRPRAARTTRSAASAATRAYLAGLEVAVPVRRGHEDAQGDRQGRPVRGRDPAVHRQRRRDALLRQRQRTARASRSATSRPARSCTASRCPSSRRARSSGTAARATASA